MGEEESSRLFSLSSWMFEYQSSKVDVFLHTGEPGWESLIGCLTASLEPWELWIPHCYCKLLQGCSPGVGCSTWSPASPAAPREHLATPKGPATSEAATLRFPAGCSTGNDITKGGKEWSFICRHKDCLVPYLEDIATTNIWCTALPVLERCWNTNAPFSISQFHIEVISHSTDYWSIHSPRECDTLFSG